jgi:hypothetical protein
MAEEVKGPVVQPVNKTYNTEEPTEMTEVKKRVPRRVLHFSDGVIEEYSTDEELEKAEEENRKREAEQQVRILKMKFQTCLDQM